jgi:outer membrane usher protein
MLRLLALLAHLITGAPAPAPPPIAAPTRLVDQAIPPSGMGDDPSAETGAALRALGLTQGGLVTVGVELDGRDLQQTTELALSHASLMIRADDVRRFRLRLPGATDETIAGESFVPLTAVPGIRFSIDAARQVLRLSAPTDSFEPTVVDGRPQALHATSPVMPSAFVSYDLSLEQDSGGHGVHALYLDAGATNHLGYLENTLIVGDTLHGRGIVRLDTSLVHDDPAGMRRLSIGDGITHGASWAPQLRFGGIRYGTDFSLQPDYLTFPTPQFSGRAAIPSNVELYINDVLGYQAPVGQGPFTLNQVPVVGGAGHVALVVKDPLGVEQRIVSSFYVSTQMLRTGLSDFSIEAGGLRENYGMNSFDYRHAFASGSYRRGLNSNVTVEAHGEVSSGIQSAGAGVAATYRDWAEFGGAVAASRSDRAGDGVLYRGYVEHTDTNWSLSATYQGTTRRYRQIGDDQPADRIRQIIQASAGVTLGRWGSVNGALAQIRRGDGATSRVISANYNREIRRVGYLSAYVLESRTTAGRADTTVGLSFTAALGRRSSASLTGDQHNQRADIQRTAPDEGGWGYRFSAARGQLDERSADVTYRGQAFETTAEVSHFQGETAGRVLASGSLVYADGTLFPARRLNGSYAIVDVDGQSGVRIYQDNRFVATTNASGRAIVNQLRPYEDNHLSIEPTDLQLDTTLGAQSQILDPPARAAVLAHFSIRPGHAGSLIVQHADGKAIAPGTAVGFAGGAEPATVGYDGEVFVPNLKTGLTVTVHDAGGDCTVVVPDVARDDVLPKIGPLVCRKTGDHP